ncbi:MAG: hypothetical protein AB1Z98_28170, partial [Nannocystaceae bacterium]
IDARLRQDAPGDYELVFLVQNMETLVFAVCSVTGRPAPSRKPNPDERDRILAGVVWGETPEVRRRIRDECPSFDRIVGKVAAPLRTMLGVVS